MKKSSRPIIFLLSAAITFGSLFAIAGPKHFGKHGCQHYQHEQCDRKNNDSSNHDTMQKPGKK